MSSLARDKPLDIYGPPGLAKLVASMRKLLGFTTTFPIRISEVQPGDEIDRRDYVLRSALAKHDIPCLAYAVEDKERPGRFHPEKARRLGVPEGPQWGELQNGKSVRVNSVVVEPKQVMDSPRPGLKFVYAIDTRPSDSIKDLAKNADLLVHDGGFVEERRPKAEEYFHSTAREAATVAKAARAKRLALVHISAVTRDSSILLKEARRHFKATIVPDDLSTLSLKRSK
jgi:ribonuclease Z